MLASSCPKGLWWLRSHIANPLWVAGNGLEGMLQDPGGGTAGIMRAQQARRLLLPGEMGEAFRVIGLSRELGPALQGFALLDLATRL